MLRRKYTHEVSNYEYCQGEDSSIGALQRGNHPSLADEGAITKLDGATGWLDSAPLGHKSQRGKVVLVNFWTYTCINSIRPLPYLRNWTSKYHDADFVVIGVHTPEFSFEHEPVNVENAVRNLNVTFLVATDSEQRVWQSFNNLLARPVSGRRERTNSLPPLWGRRLWRHRARHSGTPEGKRSN